MANVVKSDLRKIYRVIADWPLVGRLARIGAAGFRLPEIKAACLTLIERQSVSAEQTIATLSQSLSELSQRQSVFEKEQLPALLQTLSDINHRQLATDNDRDNLVKSVPVALRKNTREVIEIRSQLERLAHSVNDRVDAITETLHTLEDLRVFIETRVADTQRQVGGVGGAMDLLRGQLESAMTVAEGRDGEVRRLVEDAEKLVAEMRAQLEGVRSINETRTQVGNAMNSISYLLGRVEFVRRELMFEMRYGANSSGNGEQMKATTRILSPEKLEAARQRRLRLNLGCGHISLDGYLNVDRRELPGVDIIAEVDDLPFGTEEVDEIFSSHLLEHFPVEQLTRQLLPYLVSLLKHSGEFHAIVPDAQAMIQHYANGSYAFADLREVTFGSQDYDGDFHYNMFTPQSLSDALQGAGLKNVRVVEAGRRNGVCYEFEIVANK